MNYFIKWRNSFLYQNNINVNIIFTVSDSFDPTAEVSQESVILSIFLHVHISCLSKLEAEIWEFGDFFL